MSTQQHPSPAQQFHRLNRENDSPDANPPPKPTLDTTMVQTHLSHSPVCSFPAYLRNIKKQLSENTLENEDAHVKRIIKVFMAQAGKDQFASLRFLISCIYGISLILSRGSVTKTTRKAATCQKFLGCLLRLQVKDILDLYQNMENCLCFILNLIRQVGFFDKNRHPRLLQSYKRFTLQLFDRMSDNPKVVFRTLLALESLQMMGLLLPSDYAGRQLLVKIRQRTARFPGGNLVMFDLAYKVLLNGDGCQEAVLLYNQMLSLGKTNGVQGFFRAINSSETVLSQVVFGKILEGQMRFPTISSQGSSSYPSNQLAPLQGQPQDRLQAGFYQVLRRQLNEMTIISFINAIQSGLIQSLSLKCVQTRLNKNLAQLVSVVGVIKGRASETLLSEAILDKLRVLLPLTKLGLTEAVERIYQGPTPILIA